MTLLFMSMTLLHCHKAITRDLLARTQLKGGNLWAITAYVLIDGEARRGYTPLITQPFITTNLSPSRRWPLPFASHISSTFDTSEPCSPFTFQALFDAAVQGYKAKTEKTLTAK